MAQWYLNDTSDVPYFDEFIDIPSIDDKPEYKDYTHWLIDDSSDIPYRTEFIGTPTIDDKPVYRDLTQWLLDDESDVPYRIEFLNIIKLGEDPADPIDTLSNVINKVKLNNYRVTIISDL